MNTQTFTQAIKKTVYDAAAKGVVEVLHKPAGRRPDPELVRLSQWFNSLNAQDQQAVARVANLAADQATYNFLLVLDGLVTVEPVGEKGKLELFYDNGKERTQLNDENTDQLSSLFKNRLQP